MPHMISRITPPEFDELIAFLDRAFGHRGQLTFPSLLPALYGPEPQRCEWNHALRVDGRLAAVVGLFPIHWRTPGGVLRLTGIGGVAVGPEFRRGGLMRELMAHIVDVASQEGYHLSFLFGQRQRYRHFGYETAGRIHVVRFEPPNMRHAFGDEPVRVALRPCAFDGEEIAVLQRLHDAQAFHCERKRLTANLRSWYHVPIVAVDADGLIVGYAVVSEDRREVYELVARDADTAVQIVRAVMAESQGAVKVYLANAPRDVFEACVTLAEQVFINPAGNWQVFDWPSTVQALLKARHAEAPLMQGQATLAADDVTFRITVDGTGPRCQLHQGPADLALSGPQMTQLLFGPLNPWEVVDSSPAILNAWCPLPLALPRQDHV